MTPHALRKAQFRENMTLSNLARASRFALSLSLLVIASGCHSSPSHPDRPYVAPGVLLQDVTFHSAALDRDMPYRVFLPTRIAPGTKLAVIYLLHGANGTFRDWSNDSTVSTYAAKSLILVMPEGEFSYYMNAVEKPVNRFEDYTFTDLIHDVESRFPAARTRDKRALIGISMGGFAGLKIAFTRPDLFGFVAAISPPIEIVHRRFSVRRWGEWSRVRTIFGPVGSNERRLRDPMTLIRSADPAKTPYIYLTVGESEPLLDPDRRFADQLKHLHFNSEFHTMPGGHDWNEWNMQLSGCFESLLRHVNINISDPGPSNSKPQLTTADR
jgi:putative tributyrin esterase